MGDDGSALVFCLRSRTARRLWGAFIAFLLVFLVSATIWGRWWNVATALALLVGQVPLFVLSLQRTIIDRGGITVDHRWRKRRVPWQEIDTVRLHWRAVDGNPTFAIFVSRSGNDRSPGNRTSVRRGRPRSSVRTLSTEPNHAPARVPDPFTPLATR